MIIRTNVTVPTESKKVEEKKETKITTVNKVPKKKKVAVPVQPIVEPDAADEIIKKVSEWDFDD